MTNTIDYGFGDIISVTTWGPGLRTVRVTDREDNVKNGMPGFVGTVVSGIEAGLNVWGYDDQIVEVLERAES